MSQYYNRPTQVQTDDKGRPTAFYWRGRWKPITQAIQKQSKPTSDTLFPDPETVRYQCTTGKGMICDLARIGEVWVLERIWN
ncbi:MAG: hypothetical protein HPY50_09245 [Firmicutes bacterium]|nr:hypothetical protein [Bacillota bacterium]